MRRLSERARPLIQAVFTKAYLEQATGTAPWGVTPSGCCSYELGCAVGRSLPGEITPRMHGLIDDILTYDTHESYYPGVRELLLGERAVPAKGDDDVECYSRIQIAHDATWRDENRALYRQMLENVAEQYGLEVPVKEDHEPQLAAAL